MTRHIVERRVLTGASLAVAHAVQQCPRLRPKDPYVYLKAGLLDEMQIHVVPGLFGDGTRLFQHLGSRRIELKRTRTIDTPGATHLRFSVQT